MADVADERRDQQEQQDEEQPAAKKPRPAADEPAAAAAGADAPASRETDADKAAAAAARAPATTTATEPPQSVLESGRLFFLYKPRVALEPGDVMGLADVQRFYLLLQPELSPSAQQRAEQEEEEEEEEAPPPMCRLVVVGKKRLPQAGASHERFYAYVAAAGAALPSDLTAGMVEARYSTATRGERVQGAARAAGQARYVIARGGQRNAPHLAYKLVLPAGGSIGEAQAALGIQAEGSFAVSVKSPEQKGRGRGLPSAGPPPELSERQRALFAGRAWIPLEDPSLLDVVGVELLLIGARDDPIESGELGPAGEFLEEEAAADGEGADDGDDAAAVLRQLLEPTPEQVGAAHEGADGSAQQPTPTMALQEGAAKEGGKEGGKEGSGGAGDDEPIPVAPALTGELV